jgi:molybdate-binding protein/DNA-binding XRE family transcriptional regulator
MKPAMTSEPDTLPSTLRTARIERGLSQAELAARAGISRQSLGAIEAGRVDPALSVVRAIAKALDLGLDALVGASTEPAALPVEHERPTQAGLRVVLGRGPHGWIAFPIDGADGDAAEPADALVRDDGAVDLLDERAGHLEETLVLPGCTPLLGLAARRLGARTTWLHRNSADALRLLGSGKTLLAGVHGTPRASKLSGPRTGRTRVALTRWETGLVMRPGTRVRTLMDLAKRGTRVAVREAEAQTRHLLDELIQAAGLDPSTTLGHTVVLRSHLTLARAVQLGAADVAFAPRSAALALGLAFVPLATERFDLVLANGAERDPRVTRLLDIIRTPAFRREASALGYEPTAASDP